MLIEGLVGVLMLTIYYELKIWLRVVLLVERKKLEVEDIENDYRETGRQK